MKGIVRHAAWILAAAPVLLASPAHAQVGVSINVPGVYGQIDIGGYPPPQTIYAQPTVIERGPAYVDQPLYLHVPPGQERQWRRYCRQYDACGRPVYFVRDTWYRDVYAPRYRQMHGDDRRGPPGRDERGRGPDRGYDDRGHDDRGHDDRGPDGRGYGDREHDDRGRGH